MTDRDILRRWITLCENDVGVRSLAELMTWADTQGVELWVTDTDARIELHDIGRVVGAKGSGAAVMRGLCRFADQQHKPIALEALDDVPKRIAYFRRFGFVSAPQEPKIDDAGTLMVRPPGNKSE